MSDSDNPKNRKPKEKYLFLGYGIYGGQPNLQLGGGLARNPDFLKPLLQWLGLIEKDPPPDSEHPQPK